MIDDQVIFTTVLITRIEGGRIVWVKSVVVKGITQTNIPMNTLIRI